jgi:hypothetical protein
MAGRSSFDGKSSQRQWDDFSTAFRMGAEYGTWIEKKNQEEAANAEPSLCSRLLSSFVLGTQTAAVNSAVSIASLLATGFLATNIGPVFDEKRPLAPARHLMTSVFGLPPSAT